MSYGKTTMTDVEGNPIPTSVTVNEVKGYSALGSGERAAGNAVKGEVAGVAGKPLGGKAGGAEAAVNIGASSLVNGWRLNMQVTAEQAAGARMPVQIGEYSEHALQQIAGRDGGVGVSKSSLLDAWTNPIKIDYVPTKYGPTFRLTGNDAAIVVNLDGKVVTGWATSSKGTGK
jgi:filamentous hemagglutinin